MFTILFFYLLSTVCSEWFLYKVAPPELKISPIMYFVMYNSVVLSKILKIVVPLEQNFEKTDFYSIKLVILIIIDIGKQQSKWHTELCMTKYIIGEIFSSGGATLYKNPSDQTVGKSLWLLKELPYQLSKLKFPN